MKFDKEISLKKAKDDDEKLKGLTPKEREEWKRVGTRLSGRAWVSARSVQTSYFHRQAAIRTR